MNAFIFAIVVFGIMLYVAQLVISFVMFITDQFKTKKDFIKSFIPFRWIYLELKTLVTEIIFTYKRLK